VDTPTPNAIATLAELRKGLEQLRYFAAAHSWSSGSQEAGHEDVVKANIQRALDEYHDQLFENAAPFFRNIFLSYDDHVTCKSHPSHLLSDGDTSHDCALAKYLHLIQHPDGSFPGVRKCFFEDPKEEQGIVTFVLGDAAKIETVAKTQPPRFQHRIVTLPRASTSFYDVIAGFTPVETLESSSKTFLRTFPSKPDPYPGMTIPEPAQLWNGKEASVISEVIQKLKNSDGRSHEPALRTLANLSIILQHLKFNDKECAYHYYYFRPLPHNDDPFHRFGQGVLSWGTDAFTNNETEKTDFCQNMAITGCTLFSRLADAAMPVHTRRAAVFLASQVILSRTNRSWLAENVLIPIILGGTAKVEEGQYAIALPAGTPKTLSVPKGKKERLLPVLDDLCRLLNREDQIRHLAEVLRPLRPEGVTAGDIALLSDIDHEAKDIKDGLDAPTLRRIKGNLHRLLAYCANAGPLFTEVAAKIRHLESTFNTVGVPTNWSSAKDELLAETALVRRSTTELLDRLCKKISLDQPNLLRLESQEYVKWCKQLPQTDDSGRPLPIYLSNLELALDALLSNKNRYNHASNVSAQIFYGPEWLAVIWAENVAWTDEKGTESWEVWKSKVLTSAKKNVSRGIPLVLATALESAADLVWVAFNGSFPSDRPLVGNKSLINALENDGLPEAVIKGGEFSYAIGFAYHAWKPEGQT
jgi:hypothetical protein